MPSPFGRRRVDSDPYRLIIPGMPGPSVASPSASCADRMLLLLLLSVVGACAIVFVFGAGLWALDYRLVRGPTPTATATRASVLTGDHDSLVTPNVPAAVTPQPGRPASPLEGGGSEVALPIITGITGSGAPLAGTPGGLTLPIISSDLNRTPETPGSAQLSPLVTPSAKPIALPLIAAEQGPTPASESPTSTPAPLTVTLISPLPAAPPTLVELTGEAPTATPTLALPPPTSTVTPTPLPPIYTVASLEASIGAEGATVYIGPSTLYTATGTLSAGEEVRLIGRNPTGEWVYICCLDNENVWVRQYNAQPSDNELQAGAPDDADPNNVRWLNVQPTPTTLYPLWTPSPVVAEDYLLYRYDRGNRAQFAHLPNPPATFAAWANAAQAGQSLISPVAVSGQSVIVASADNHLYSFDRFNGNQRWRYDLSRPMHMAPTVQDGIIYVVDDTGQMTALKDRGNEAEREWTTALGIPPTSSFNVYSDTLFISTAQDTRIVNRGDGRLERALTVQGGASHFPAIGGQLLYVAGTTLIAYDIYSVMDPGRQPQIVWQYSDSPNPTAPLLYSWPGITAVAELYVVDGNNRIRCLDANTHREVWNKDNDERATGLAVNDATLFVSGNGYAKAYKRLNGDLLWRTDVGSNVLGGPYADNTKAIIYLENGTVQFLDSASGAVISTATIPSTASSTSAAAISGQYIFAPGANGRLQALIGLP